MSSEHEMSGDFEAEVIARSHEIPVLVDFWAEWCGPCRVLGPVLESMAARAGTDWELVKVNTEAHPEVAQRFDIRSIPAVKLFAGGAVVAEFVGALNEAQVGLWLAENLPGPAHEAWQKAQALLEGGAREEAETVLSALLELHPAHDEARLELARLLLEKDIKAARAHLESITGDANAYGTAQHLLHLVSVIEWAQSDRTLAGDHDAALVELYRGGAHHFAHGEPGKALEAWIDVVGRDRGLDDDGARRACIALFSILGEGHPLTQEWRRRFSMALSV